MGLIVIRLAGKDLVGAEQLLQQHHPRELVGQGHRPERQAQVAALELDPARASDHEAEFPSLLAALLDPLAERLRVEAAAVVREQHDVRAVRDPRRHLLVLAHLQHLDPGKARDQLAVVLDVVLEGRAQPADRDHGDPHGRACDTKAVPEENTERHFNIHTDPDTMAGHYANFANVSHSDYEFTITFARVDHEVDEGEVPGVVVSRINLSPRFMRELIDAMEDNFSKWSTREGIRDLPELDDDVG